MIGPVVAARRPGKNEEHNIVFGQAHKERGDGADEHGPQYQGSPSNPVREQAGTDGGQHGLTRLMPPMVRKAASGLTDGK